MAMAMAMAMAMTVAMYNRHMPIQPARINDIRERTAAKLGDIRVHTD